MFPSSVSWRLSELNLDGDHGTENGCNFLRKESRDDAGETNIGFNGDASKCYREHGIPCCVCERGSSTAKAELMASMEVRLVDLFLFMWRGRVNSRMSSSSLLVTTGRLHLLWS